MKLSKRICVSESCEFQSFFLWKLVMKVFVDLVASEIKTVSILLPLETGHEVERMEPTNHGRYVSILLPLETGHEVGLVLAH